jgi:hypothetical protein
MDVPLFSGFVEKVITDHIDTKDSNRDVPALRHLASRPSLEEIEEAVMAVLADNAKLARQAAIHLSHLYSGRKLRTIGERYHVGQSAVSEASRDFLKKMEKDGSLREEIVRIIGKLKI